MNERWYKKESPESRGAIGALIFLLPKKKENFMIQNYILSVQHANELPVIFYDVRNFVIFFIWSFILAFVASLF